MEANLIYLVQDKFPDFFKAVFEINGVNVESISINDVDGWHTALGLDYDELVKEVHIRAVRCSFHPTFIGGKFVPMNADETKIYWNDKWFAIEGDKDKPFITNEGNEILIETRISKKRELLEAMFTVRDDARLSDEYRKEYGTSWEMTKVIILNGGIKPHAANLLLKLARSKK